MHAALNLDLLWLMQTVGVFYRENSRYSRATAIHYVVTASAFAELAGIVEASVLRH